MIVVDGDELTVPRPHSQLGLLTQVSFPGKKSFKRSISILSDVSSGE